MDTNKRGIPNMTENSIKHSAELTSEEKKKRNDELFGPAASGPSILAMAICDNILGIRNISLHPSLWFDESEGKDGRKIRTFNVKRFSDAILDNVPVVHTIDSDDLFVWFGDHYEPNGEHHIGKVVNAQLQEDFSIDKKNKVIDYVRTATHQNMRDVRTHDELRAPDSLIPFKNGIYDLSSNHLNPYTKEFFFTTKLKMIYDPEAKCPKFLEFLREVVPYEQDRATLQEYCGLCLTQNLRFHNALFLVGPTHSGKSTFCNVIKAAWGPLSINIPLQTLMESGNSGEFARARLFGKLVNVFPDIPKENMDNDSWFLALTGNDYISARTPCHSSFDFPSTAKQIYTANKLPKTENHRDEFFIRVLIVLFPNMFLPWNPKYDPYLIDKLTTDQELSGLANWALEGLKAVLKNGQITRRLDIEETKRAWEATSDSVSRYVEDPDQVIQDNNGFADKDELYYDYVQWCSTDKGQNEIPEDRDVFLKEFRQHFPNIKEDRPTFGDKRKRVYRGITLKKQKKGEQTKF